MDPVVILSKIEQEYLLRIIESSLHVRDVRGFFLWSQGQLQALLPHQLLVCLQFDSDGALQRLESVHAGVPDAATARLCDPHDGLALRLARRCGNALPWMADTPDEALCGYDNAIVHGTGPLAGGATTFALFGLPMKPGPRHAYFLDLLLPHLHLLLVRLTRASPAMALPVPRALSQRETEVVRWLREGKRNDEIGIILGISALTVKNHLQRIYKLLGVRNRGEAVARCSALRLVKGGTGTAAGAV